MSLGKSRHTYGGVCPESRIVKVGVLIVKLLKWPNLSRGQHRSKAMKQPKSDFTLQSHRCDE